ncbi:MAG: hypothetical protein ACI8PB_002199 [Desulforhopalus sp.]|jgi:hypothetical protein
MDIQPTRFGAPVAFKVALVNLTLGALGLMYSLLSCSFSTGGGELSIGLILLGMGEYINNPQVDLPDNSDELQSKTSIYLTRKRNVSSLGNLLDIAGILMIATGIATLQQ